ncbi:MAG: hypothetical protein E7048_06530 [Lentisphaerae bacterium]|nr:hypothetical protein [Lentisphaerota bacterium]MBR2872325.1 hypothetical protein [Lentisphaeria bacterium]
MDETKATCTGVIGGAAAGLGITAVGTLALPVLGPVLASYVVIGGMVGGAAAGGKIALRIAEKVNGTRKN